MSRIGQYDRATLLYRELLECNPLDVGAYRALGDALHEQGDVTEALAAFKRADELSDENDSVPIGYGIALEKNGEVDAAIGAFRESFEYFAEQLQQTPDDSTSQSNLRAACVNIARLLREQGQPDAAISYLDRAGELGVSDRWFWTEYALCHRELGHHDEYERGCQLVIAEFPPPDERRIADWGHLSQRLYRLGKYQEAREGLEMTIKKRRDDGPTLKYGPRWWYYTLTLGQLGETAQAQKQYKQLSQLMNEQPSATVKLYEDLQAKTAELLAVEQVLETDLGANEQARQLEE